MNSTFSKILELSLKHNYYNNGLCPDFSIKPTAQTKDLLKRLRCIFKATTNGFFLSCDNLAKEIMPQILIKGNTRLCFIMELRKTNFLNFTTLPSRSGGKDIYYIHNEGKNKELSMKTVAMYPSVFTYKFPATASETSLLVKDSEGKTYINESYTNKDQEEYSASIDLGSPSSGLYHFNVSGRDEDESIYISNESLGNGIFGLIEITLPVDSNSKNPIVYQYQFNAKSLVWEYHLLFSKDYDSHSFEITGIVKGEETTEQGDIIEAETTEGEIEKKEIVFIELNPATTYSKGNSSVFIAKYKDKENFIPVRIPYREAPRTDMQLIINHIDNKKKTMVIMLKPLSNPAISNPEPKVYLTV